MREREKRKNFSFFDFFLFRFSDFASFFFLNFVFFSMNLTRRRKSFLSKSCLSRERKRKKRKFYINKLNILLILQFIYILHIKYINATFHQWKNHLLTHKQNKNSYSYMILSLFGNSNSLIWDLRFCSVLYFL